MKGLKLLAGAVVLGLAGFAGNAAAEVDVHIGLGSPGVAYYEDWQPVVHEHHYYRSPRPVYYDYDRRPNYRHYSGRPAYNDYYDYRDHDRRGHDRHHHHHYRDYDHGRGHGRHHRRDHRDDRHDRHYGRGEHRRDRH